MTEFTRAVFSDDMTSGDIVKSLKSYYKKLAGLRSKSEPGPRVSVSSGFAGESEWLINYNDFILIVDDTERCSEDLFTRAAESFGVKPSMGGWSIDFRMWVVASLAVMTRIPRQEQMKFSYLIFSDSEAVMSTGRLRSMLKSLLIRWYTPTELEITERQEKLSKLTQNDESLVNLVKVYEKDSTLFEPRPRREDLPQTEESKEPSPEHPEIPQSDKAKHERLRHRIDELLDDLEGKSLACIADREVNQSPERKRRRRKRKKHVEKKYKVEDLLSRQDTAADLQTAVGMLGRPSADRTRNGSNFDQYRYAPSRPNRVNQDRAREFCEAFSRSLRSNFPLALIILVLSSIGFACIVIESGELKALFNMCAAFAFFGAFITLLFYCVMVSRQLQEGSSSGRVRAAVNLVRGVPWPEGPDFGTALWRTLKQLLGSDCRRQSADMAAVWGRSAHRSDSLYNKGRVLALRLEHQGLPHADRYLSNSRQSLGSREEEWS
ncbi:hypothetical protein FOL47_008558 [Perkinsus chesapeaki]|uniref:Uncharacterized protein n=1 Tax=Perkinsus chesapeaki TaxID=330153 RepID=A0A7J6LDZ2_PERCH|nr:hypothetical protein FOL47_008558 [Perkinsus chesapeaki]